MQVQPGSLIPADPIYPEFMACLRRLFYRLERPTFAESYRLAVRMARQHGWAFPSLEAARRRIKQEAA